MSVPGSTELGKQGMQPFGPGFQIDEATGSSDDDLTWQHLSSRYEEAGLMLFKKRIDTLRNPRNGQTFDRLVLESVDWVNVVALDAKGRSLMIRQFRSVSAITPLKHQGMVDPGRGQQNCRCSGCWKKPGIPAVSGNTWVRWNPTRHL